MSEQTKIAFSRVLDWVYRSLGLTLISGSATAQACSSEQQERLLVPETKDVPICGTSGLRDAEAQMFPATAIVPLPLGLYCESQSSRAEQSAWTDRWERENRSQDDNCGGEQDPDLGPAQYTDGPSRVVKVNDGTKDCIAFVLTEETVMLLADVIQKRKGIRSILHNYQEISHIAGTAQDFLDYAPVMLEETTSQEGYDNLTKDIERRQLEVSRNVERKACLEKELHSKEQDLNDSRGQLEDDLERLLVEAKLAHDDGQDRTKTHLEMISTTGIPEDDEMPAQHSPSAETELADPDPMEDVWSARQRLFEAQVEFDDLPELQEQQKRQYRSLRREEQADFPESELDLLQLQDARRATRALIEAEEAFEEARARVHGDGIFSNDIDSEITLSEYTGMGSGAGYDPALMNPSFDPTRVQAWAEKVPQCQEQEDTDPEVDAWDSRTVTMSDSISVVAEGNERRLIHRWQCICDSSQEEASKSDMGVMDNLGCLQSYS